MINTPYTVSYKCSALIKNLFAKTDLISKAGYYKYSENIYVGNSILYANLGLNIDGSDNLNFLGSYVA